MQNYQKISTSQKIISGLGYGNVGKRGGEVIRGGGVGRKMNYFV